MGKTNMSESNFSHFPSTLVKSGFIMEYTLFKKSFRSTLELRVAQRGYLDVGSQKAEEKIGEGENLEMVTLAKGQVVEVSLFSASFLPQTTSYLHFPVPVPWAET